MTQTNTRNSQESQKPTQKNSSSKYTRTQSDTNADAKKMTGADTLKKAQGKYGNFDAMKKVNSSGAKNQCCNQENLCK